MRLSVIVPAYNRGRLIGETIRSLLAQTLRADEIIVVDDGSTDDTATVAASFGPPVRVISRSNGGPAAARNTGFAASSGEFIHFFDSDDLAAENKHEVQVSVLEKTGTDIAVGPWIQGHFKGTCFEAANTVLQQHGLPDERDLIKPLLTGWTFVPHSAIFRRSIVEAAGGFDESLFVGEDQLMFLKCLLAGARVVHSPGTIEFYRLGEAGKITEDQQWSVRRLHECAGFLLKARDLCRRQYADPLRWFGYRRWLWEIEQELKKSRSDDIELQTRLRQVVPNGRGATACWCHRNIERWRGGLQQRLTGGRAHKSFKSGAMSGEQRLLLNKLGYSYRAPGRLPWWPQRPFSVSNRAET